MEELLTATAIVVGSINRDIVAFAPRLPMPGETVLGTRGALFPGGKGANQAVAIARLGSACRMIARVGTDMFGNEMTAFLAAEGVDISGVARMSGVATGFALITVDDQSENCITVVPGANSVWPEGLPPVRIASNDIVVAQLEVPLDVVIQGFERARAADARTVLNPAPFQRLPDALLAITDAMVLNETELAALAELSRSIDPNDQAALAKHVATIVAKGPRVVVVTLGGAGVSVHMRDAAPVRLTGHKVAARDTTGAGDCFVGAFVHGLLACKDPVAAARFANAAAALSVTREGAAASFPTRREVELMLG
jgi:ribokinase